MYFFHLLSTNLTTKVNPSSLQLFYRTYFQQFWRDDGSYRQTFTIIHLRGTHLKFFATFDSLAETNSFSLWIWHFFILKFSFFKVSWPSNFLRTVKEPSSETLLRLAELVLTLSCFSFGNNYHKQTNGVAKMIREIKGSSNWFGCILVIPSYVAKVFSKSVI